MVLFTFLAAPSCKKESGGIEVTGTGSAEQGKYIVGMQYHWAGKFFDAATNRNYNSVIVAVPRKESTDFYHVEAAAAKALADPTGLGKAVNAPIVGNGFTVIAGGLKNFLTVPFQNSDKQTSEWNAANAYPIDICVAEDSATAPSFAYVFAKRDATFNLWRFYLSLYFASTPNGPQRFDFTPSQQGVESQDHYSYIRPLPGNLTLAGNYQTLTDRTCAATYRIFNSDLQTQAEYRLEGNRFFNTFETYGGIGTTRD